MTIHLFVLEESHPCYAFRFATRTGCTLDTYRCSLKGDSLGVTIYLLRTLLSVRFLCSFSGNLTPVMRFASRPAQAARSRALALAERRFPLKLTIKGESVSLRRLMCLKCLFFNIRNRILTDVTLSNDRRALLLKIIKVSCWLVYMDHSISSGTMKEISSLIFCPFFAPHPRGVF